MKLKRTIINTKHAPKAGGPYNQAIMIDRTLYISGQLGVNPETMKMVPGGVVEETIQALRNMQEILKRAHSDFQDVIKTTILLKDMNDFQAVNEIYSQHFSTDMPARVAFQVGALPKNGKVQIDAVARVGVQTAGAVYERTHKL